MEISKVPNSILAKKLVAIPSEDIGGKGLKELIADMRVSMKEHHGIGLSANQIGKDLRLFVIDPALAGEYGIPDAFINPEITEYSKDEDELEEGCLSIPKYYTAIKRAKKVKIKAYDEDGKKFKFRARGLLARVLQHETDHLNGITIKDRYAPNPKH